MMPFCWSLAGGDQVMSMDLELVATAVNEVGGPEGAVQREQR